MQKSENQDGTDISVYNHLGCCLVDEHWGQRNRQEQTKGGLIWVTQLGSSIQRWLING